TLRDGRVALGQVVDPATRGKVVLLIRRSWAEAHVPDWAARWEKAEAAWARRARRERRERLSTWRRERATHPEGHDPISAWLAGELARLADDAPIRTPLMAVQLSRAEVRDVETRPKGVGRLLRQGWRAGFDDAEEIAASGLKEALEGRGFALDGSDAAKVD